MDIRQSFHAFLNAPFAESLDKDFEAARAALEGAELPATLQAVLEGIASEKEHMAFARKAGLFLSAALQALRADQTLDLSVLGEDIRLDCLGACNRGPSLSVKGDVGNYAGAHMEAGTLTIEGDAEDYAGAGMKGGVIQIKGLAENHLGHSMAGGEIVVARNGHDFIGNSMTGGHIVVRANAGYSAGYRMLGGLIEIQDLTWDLCGEEMVGGRITVGGHIGHDLGFSMVGGELGLNEKNEGAQRTKAGGGKLVILKKGKKSA